MTILNHRIIGEGEVPLVILHGLFGCLDNWQSIGKNFSEFTKVILVDQRNHGKSPHFDKHNYEAMSADLDYLLDELDVKTCYLLGHSMGGKTAMKYAVEHPERIEKLLIADIGPKPYPPHHQLILKALNSVDFKEQKSRNSVVDKISESINNPGIVQFLVKGVGRDANQNLVWKFNLPILTEQIENIGEPLDKDDLFDKEVLFIKGENSDYIVNGDEIFIQKIFPKAEIKTISNAGHWIHAENPEDFQQVVIDFLKL